MDPKQTQLSGASPGAPGTGAQDGRSAEEIARSIAARRAEMNVLADALEERLAPRRLAGEVSEAVKRQLQGRTRRAVSAVSGSIRNDPFPWLLMGLGAAWLVKERRQRSASTRFDARRFGGRRFGASKRPAGRSYDLASEPMIGVSGYGGAGYGMGPSGESAYAPVSGLSDPGVLAPVPRARPLAGEGLSEPVGGKAADLAGAVTERAEEARDKVAATALAAKERVAETAHAVRETAQVAREKVAEKAHETRARISTTVERAGRKVSETAYQARAGVVRSYDSSPLLLGLAALAGGVLLGAAIPSTRREEEVLGPVRDRWLDQVRSSGREVAERVTRVAEAAVHTGVGELERQDAGGSLSEQASAVAEAAGQAAKREAERQGLTREATRETPMGSGIAAGGGSAMGRLAPPAGGASGASSLGGTDAGPSGGFEPARGPSTLGSSSRGSGSVGTGSVSGSVSMHGGDGHARQPATLRGSDPSRPRSDERDPRES
jgi:hypothetical protein